MEPSGRAQAWSGGVAHGRETTDVKRRHRSRPVAVGGGDGRFGKSSLFTMTSRSERTARFPACSRVPGKGVGPGPKVDPALRLATNDYDPVTSRSILALTSGWRRTATLWAPTVLIGL